MREFTCEHGNHLIGYTCDECGGEFVSDQTEADVIMEYEQRFSDKERTLGPPAFVCEACYNKALEMTTVYCHCGQPIHYQDPCVEILVKKLVQLRGEFARVTEGGRTWLVQRHYIALHGVKVEELPFLGFREVTGQADPS